MNNISFLKIRHFLPKLFLLALFVCLLYPNRSSAKETSLAGDQFAIYLPALNTPPARNGILIGNSTEGLQVIDEEGTLLRNLLEKPPIYSASWSPDGSQIAVSHSSTSPLQVYTMSYLGGNLQSLDPTRFLGWAQWHPNGQSLILTGGPLVCCETWYLHRINPDGSGYTRVTSRIEGESLAQYSPDGSQIVYMKFLSNNSESLYIMNADGSNDRLLSNLHGYARWSPDGSKIAFSAIQPNETSRDIYTINPDGTDLTQITFNGNSLTPVWSPDGERIAFLMNGNSKEGDVYLMKNDGSEMQRITTGIRATQVFDWR